MSKRACYPCRRRKVKCDFLLPQCSICRVSHIPCGYLSPVKKRGPKGSRALRVATPGSQPSDANVDPLMFADNSLGTGSGTTARSYASPPGFSILEPVLSLSESCSTPDVRPAEPLTGQVAQSIRVVLVDTLHAIFPQASIGEIVNGCISLYIEYLFPLLPICHEALLRECASLDIGAPSLPDHTVGTSTVTSSGGWVDFASLRAFTLVTALCAATAFVIPETIYVQGHLVARPFFRASREMLKLYQDHDIEDPNSTSLAIRSFHSACLHSTGQTRASWHILGEARLLAQHLRLYDEQTYAGMDAIDAQLFRYQFWMLYLSDKSAAILGGHPIGMHETLLDSEVSTAPFTTQSVLLLDPRSRYSQPPFEEHLLQGVDICRRLWSTAADLILGVKAYGRRPTPTTPFHSLHERPSMAHLMKAYLGFTCVLDELPPWIQAPESIICADAEVFQYQKRCFWSQRTNLQVTFFCLKMIILRHCIENSAVAVLGLSDAPLMLAMRKSEIAQEFLHVIEEAPFESLQINGESCVEKIRQVGVVLLELTQVTDNDRIVGRAKICFARLLDILARLNSRVSGELSSDMMT